MFLQSVLIVGKYFGFNSIFSFIEVIIEANTVYVFVILFVIAVDLGVLTHVCIFHSTQLTLALIISSLQFLVHYSFTILPNVRCSSFSFPFHWFELYHLLPVWSVSLIIWVKTYYIKRRLLWNLEVFCAYINQASIGTQDRRKIHKLTVKVVSTQGSTQLYRPCMVYLTFSFCAKKSWHFVFKNSVYMASTS